MSTVFGAFINCPNLVLFVINVANVWQNFLLNTRNGQKVHLICRVFDSHFGALEFFFCNEL